ncbi:MAG: PIN domain-containing protein [Dethiobacter sp.]|jgi:predicted nucleic acid-binding protein|nr:PIN domain-containing protein [Dethiobacter sp.]MBS4022653.1 PIN domain-containing protein [Dethiobacter sp.]
MKIFVDTSIWIEYFKNQPEIADKIDKGLLSEIIYMVGPVISEILQGAKTESDFESLNNSIDGVPFIETDFADWRLAGELSFKLRRKGLTIPITDCLIAAISINNEAFIYSLDQHFKQIPDVKLTEMLE